jgi:hypothetical protein
MFLQLYGSHGKFTKGEREMRDMCVLQVRVEAKFLTRLCSAGDDTDLYVKRGVRRKDGLVDQYVCMA